MPVGGMKRSTKLPVGESEAVAPIAFHHLLLKTALRSSQMLLPLPPMGNRIFHVRVPEWAFRRQWEAFWRDVTAKTSEGANAR
jgi:hypothetical protein